MKYELIKDSDVGVIIDSTPILRDIKDTFEVSFVLPFETRVGTYIALFCGADGIERKVLLRKNNVLIPKELLNKEQMVSLTIAFTDGEKIIKAWKCQPLSVGTFLQERASWRQISSGLTDRELYNRIADLEKKYADAQLEYNLMQKTCQQLSVTVSKFEKQNNETVLAYNNAIKVINDLQERVYNLEKNYDPTVIK